MPIVVRARKDDSSDSVIKRYKKLSMIENITSLVKDREFHKKPAILRKEQAKRIERMKFREKMEKADKTK
ncbi:MAG: hypothetical protein UX04_C0007G0011 [Microgenomates group bacterium GW2011_GWF2_45_18]|nr:MAG: hypothetical protein UW18_C0002G0106 [Microgenomates group bacterium GW2011_GWF1_44_10]KKU01422.1 MAG: hypothetical protein UX04_C0007G0011 [Microgenomates group bacterium GW2011_GWF2_45_18]OGJ41500.1 MAG: hypothetical protein A2378_00445 [Candidatus Pacebacteria bacterium RIFOXYB1_FULL_44_10]HAU98862.1 hypothetical protein [Candidatus Paceibacterota bacterium]HAX01180.1 hypothetical protein [Candidatus Paceibacterota bacterium]